MEKIGIFYGSTTGITESVAYRLAELMHVKKEDIHDVARSKPSEIGQYDLLLLGSSTWGSGDLQDDWYDFLDGIETLDLKDKTIALFGCGDQSMSDTFCNAIGTIYHRLQKTGATFYGAFEAGDYTFDKSTAFINGKFIGLLIDDVNEPEKTENRLNHWVELLQSEYIVTQLSPSYLKYIIEAGIDTRLNNCDINSCLPIKLIIHLLQILRLLKSRA